jgi:AcrR family transcriptional regulator
VPRPTEKNDAKGLIFRTALGLFREKGLEATTMREVAKAAGVSLGLAYHYFPSKEAIVADYYRHVQQAHWQRVVEGIPKAKTLRDRLALAFHSNMEIIRQDRLVLGGVLKFVGEPHHPLSVLGKETLPVQQQTVETFRLVLEGHVPKELLDLGLMFLWTMHMGFMLYFLYDESPNQHKTRALIDGTLELAVQFFALNTNPIVQPFARPIRERIGSILEAADLTGLLKKQ